MTTSMETATSIGHPRSPDDYMDIKDMEWRRRSIA